MEFNNLLDFDFDVPKRLIALEPINPRSNSKLLVYSDGKRNLFEISNLININLKECLEICKILQKNNLI